MPRRWSLAHGYSLTIGPIYHIMGILNITPDSFFDGGSYLAIDDAVYHALNMVKQGATIIDIGGESTRPCGSSIDAKTEQKRILPVIEQLADRGDVIISVDTYRSETAQLALDVGAHIINDVWGCQHDCSLAQIAASTGAGLVLMSNRRKHDFGSDLIEDTKKSLLHSLKIASVAGVEASQIVLDPGFGFSSTTDHDILMLRNLEKLHDLGFPLLVGTSCKRFLGEITGRDVIDRSVSTSATSVFARQKGSAIFRVHDIVMNKDALAVADALMNLRQS
ncbi:dihydropteroate synthase [Candidatus Endowatersipora endosymbiont of Watersipora subatra]|uniref:dihydropteroate synthase n=1 Tax=Candidatus Endowatersipora endosymbiont of Watersipora subatra TaxID=3077946 RepID=UPI00312C7E2D